MIAILASLMVCTLACKRTVTAAPPTTRSFNMSDGTLAKVDWPAEASNDIWALYRPGNVTLLFPAGIEISGKPQLLQFVKASGLFQVLFTDEPESLTPAFERALAYCRQFGISTDELERWKTQGGGTGRIAAGAAGRNVSDALSVTVRINSGSPMFNVTIIFEVEQKPGIAPTHSQDADR